MKVKLLRVGNEEFFEDTLKGIPDDDDIVRIFDKDGKDISTSVISKSLDKFKAMRKSTLVKDDVNLIAIIEKSIDTLQKDLDEAIDRRKTEILSDLKEVIQKAKSHLEKQDECPKPITKPKPKPLPKSFDIIDLIDS